MRSQLKNKRGKLFLLHLNHAPLEPKANVIPMNYIDCLGKFCVKLLLQTMLYGRLNRVEHRLLSVPAYTELVL